MERETSDIKGHLVETKTSRSQVENATSYIKHHKNPSNNKKVWSQIGNEQSSKVGADECTTLLFTLGHPGGNILSRAARPRPDASINCGRSVFPCAHAKKGRVVLEGSAEVHHVNLIVAVPVALKGQL